jgi:formylglycine-generating enzyme required for sulfatase activity
MGSILVPAGTYLRGSAPGETALPFDEPRHQVTLTHPLFVQRHEYTQGQWLQERQQERALGDDEGCAQESCPLRDITWLQTLAIANHASAHWGLEPCYHHHEDWLHIPDDLATANYINWVGPGCQGWRLPTSAEWEYFARAGTTSPWSWGDDPNVSQEYAHAPAPTQPDQVADHPQAVGQLRPNPWGLYDIHGNVEEWVWGTEDLYPDPPMHLTNPAFTPVRQHDNFEARGGSFDALTRQLRSDYRLFALSRQSSRRRGVRLVRTVQPQP